jgi:hypothetical protein
MSGGGGDGASSFSSNPWTSADADETAGATGSGAGQEACEALEFDARLRNVDDNELANVAEGDVLPVVYRGEPSRSVAVVRILPDQGLSPTPGGVLLDRLQELLTCLSILSFEAEVTRIDGGNTRVPCGLHRPDPSDGGEVKIVGGTYRERCANPRYDALVGSGVRAAASLAASASDIHLITAVHPSEQMESGVVADTLGIKVELVERTRPVWFAYFTPLNAPVIGGLGSALRQDITEWHSPKDPRSLNSVFSAKECLAMRFKLPLLRRVSRRTRPSPTLT